MFKSPLSIKRSHNKKFILNLNNYRNTHYRVLNNLKIKYKEEMAPQIRKYKHHLDRCVIIYTVYAKSKRNFDVGNICSVHQKFFEDAFVEMGRLEDDGYRNIPMYICCFGGIDTTDPRVDIDIVVIDKDFNKVIKKKFNSILERIPKCK